MRRVATIALAALSLAAIAAFTAPLIAQRPPASPPEGPRPSNAPGQPDPSRVPAGTYKVETNHTQVLFGVDHLGFNPYYGNFSGVTGTMTLDPARPTAATLDISVPVASVKTTSLKLDEELKSPMFFDGGQFPALRFRSKSVEAQGAQARITGELTMHGVTRPVMMEAMFHGAGVNREGVATVGFEGRARVRRSEFGINYGLPALSDEVTVIVTAAFERTG